MVCCDIEIDSVEGTLWDRQEGGADGVEEKEYFTPGLTTKFQREMEVNREREEVFRH